MSLPDFYRLANRLTQGTDDPASVADLPYSRRALLAARVAQHRQGPRPVGAPPGPLLSYIEASAVFSVGGSVIAQAKRLLAEAEPELVEAIWDGQVTIGTAVRVLATHSPEEQGDYVDKVRAGYDPVRLAPPSRYRSEAAEPTSRASSRGADRHRPMLETMCRTMTAWTRHTLNDITDLDQSITPEIAKQMATELSRALRVVGRVNRQLRERANDG